MRIALLADIHGNSTALRAVLADIEGQGGVDQHLILGDLVAIGPDPIGVLELLSGLPSARFVRGNTDRYVTLGGLPAPSAEDVARDPTLLPLYTRVAQSFAWTKGAVTVAGWLEWLSALPLEVRQTLPCGARLLAVHAAPGDDDGTGVRPGQSPAEQEALLAGCEADLVCLGHVHWPQDLVVGGTRVVNPGSVSNVFPPDLRASYALLTADRDGYLVQHRRVSYDRAAVIEAVHHVRHPSAPYVERFMRGQVEPPWRSLEAAETGE